MNDETLFNQALERPIAERAEFLKEACGDDQERRQRVEALLHAHEQPAGFLASPCEPPTTAQIAERAGTTIGPYKLIEQIGEGGMGAVWMAQQSEPVKRLVAVKLIKAGMDSRQVIARFEAERQALALMDHPNIARVLDAGATAAGRPYFVMDLVRGVPITRYCDEHRLTPRQRLELFIPVCQAIQHAHQKGIIHRDLKPSNVLVALYDGRPVPKVIDFGVAKAAGQPLTEQTLITGFGHIVGTLEYMSPEQAETNQLDIDTRSDIYSLGVLLYELLTGSPPFSHKELTQSGLLEMLRVIREREPSKPSTKLSTAEGLPTLAANRSTEPAKLTKLVRGDLDWIVMKALEKDRNRRYETANGFAMDVQRYLADEPVLACPPRTFYRLKKSLHRNKGPALAALLVLVALVAGIFATSWQAIRARRAEDLAIEERDAKAQALQAEHQARQEASRAGAQTLEVLRAMTSSLMSHRIATQVEVNDNERDFFLQILNHYESLATIKGDTPESRALRAEGHYRIGIVRYRMQDWGSALPAFEQARDLYQKLAAEFPMAPDYRNRLAHCHGFEGGVLQELGRKSEAEVHIRQTVAQFKQLQADFPNDPEHYDGLGASHANLAALLGTQKNWVEAEAEFRKAMLADEQLAAVFPKVHEYRMGVAFSHLRLGLLYEGQNRKAEAIAEFRQALDLNAKLLADSPLVPNRKSVAECHRNLARLLAAQNDRTEAEAHFRAALTIETKLAMDFPAIPQRRHNLAKSLVGLGNLLLAMGKAADAEAEFRQALALQNRLVADFPDVPSYAVHLAETYSRLGLALEHQQNIDQAIAAHRQAVLRKPELPSYSSRLLNALAKGGRLDAAAAEYQAQLRHDPEDALSRYLLARVLFRNRQWEAAIGHFTQLIVRKATYPEILIKRGGAYAALGRWQEAITDFANEIEQRASAPEAHNGLARLLATCPESKFRDAPRAVASARRAVELAPTNGDFWNTLGAASYRANDWNGAIEALNKSAELRSGGNSHDWFVRAMAHWQLGEKDEARSWYDQAVEWMTKNQPRNEELRRFKAEAMELLDVRDQKK